MAGRKIKTKEALRGPNVDPGIFYGLVKNILFKHIILYRMYQKWNDSAKNKYNKI